MDMEYIPSKNHSDRAVIVLFGVRGLLKKLVGKWLNGQGINALLMSSEEMNRIPLEEFETAVRYLKEKGNTKIGIMGMSSGGMMALAAASYIPDLTLTVALTPCDFVMEGFGFEDGNEIPLGVSSLSYEGKELPYLPYAYRKDEYSQKMKEEAKETGNMMASRKMFDLSEEKHPLEEEEKIPVERIQGKVLLAGCEDDCMWDTVKYIHRMEERMTCDLTVCTYEYGTHFILPDSFGKHILPILTSILFRNGRKYRKECTASRRDLDDHVRTMLSQW